jgi:hypothetical protein
MINPLYEIRGNKIVFLDDLLHKQEKDIDLSIFKKFLEKY